MKQTKIICTIGPACQSVAALSAMMRSGMNVARLNFSHGTYEHHALLIRNIRSATKHTGKVVAIMQDLQGPKIRISELTQPLAIKAGEEIIIGKDIDLDYDIARYVKPKQRILIEDGLLELVITKITRGRKVNIYCRASNSGTIQSHKGVNLPDTHLTIPILTKKDIADLQFGLKQDVDFVALSFVRAASDIVRMRGLIKRYNPRHLELPKIVAKIERAAAIKNINEIIRESDAIMVARGDLGVETADTEVPVLQKTIIKKCLQSAKPVIVATQMLDSMTRNPRPTRAEVSDVANAIIDRADAVMLSGETAFGKYPVQAVKEMNKIIEATERSPFGGEEYIEPDEHGARVIAMAASASDLADQVKAKGIVSATDSGRTARFLSHRRPRVPIYMVTDKPKVCRQMSMLWGVTPTVLPRYHTLQKLLEHVTAELKRKKYLKKGNKVVMLAAQAIGKQVNVVELETVQ